MQIKSAHLEDIPGVLTLLQANHVSNLSEAEKENGFVTTNMTDRQLTALIQKESGVTIAKGDDGKILAFAMAGSWAYWSEWPFFAYMIEKLPEFSLDGQQLTTENSYQYGPICIDPSVRGTGLFARVFFASLASMKDRCPFMATFINQVNPRSYAAHTRKAGMTEVGTFDFNQNHYWLMACRTNLSQSEQPNLNC